MKYSGHTSKYTYRDHYTPNDAGTDSQNAYFGALVHNLLSDIFRSLTVSYTSELWQSLLVEK